MVFDDDRNPMSLEEELRIIKQVVDHIKGEYPYFELKLIICGLKIVGRPHIMKMVEDIIEGRQHSDLIAGFDLVNEEDYTPPILDFLKEIIEGKHRDKEHGLPLYFHCGETHDRFNENVYDAVMLGTKRIGHGFQLFLHPDLLETVKRQNICIEACPISNLLLGYTVDLRNHPVRFMLHRGV